MRDAMREVRVESLEGLTRREDEILLTVNAGSLDIVFPEGLWERIVAGATPSREPTPEELAELNEVRDGLERHARENAFEAVLRDVGCGGEGSGVEYDLVLRPSGLLAATTGYVFAPVVGAGLVDRVEAGLRGDGAVEQAYLIGAVAEDAALAAGDDGLMALCVRGRRCGASRFEMPPELWQVLSGDLGWRDVQTYLETPDNEER